jgi:hypothetical protein
MLDLYDFLECVTGNAPAGKISLLLFQAIMFAGSTFVDLGCLQKASFSTRVVQQLFFTREKVRRVQSDALRSF